MNHFAAYVQEIPRGYRVMVRFAQHGHPKPVMDKGDKPKVFQTKLEATEEALKHLLAYMNNEYLRIGENASSARSEAEKTFGTIFKKGKAIQVERVKAA